MKILSLSGWSQQPESLLPVLPLDSSVFDYGKYGSVEEAFKALAHHTPDILVGWSLGGQLALRAIAQKIISPQYLVLISAPFQITAATPLRILQKSRAAFLANPNRMLEDFYRNCSRGDLHENLLYAVLQKNRSFSQNWLFWFDELIKFSCAELDLSQMPPSVLIYGEEDCIVPIAQGRELAKRLPHADLHAFADCAHAPHLHDPCRVKHMISLLQESIDS